MADKSLDILIKFGLIDEAKAEKAKQLLEETAQETENVGDKTGEMSKKLEGSREVFSEIDRIVPGLGHAIHAAFSGPVGPVILLGVAIHEAFSKLKDYNAELDAISDAEVQAHATTIATVKKAWDDAQTAIGDYYAKLNTAGTEGDPIKKQLENIKAITDAKLDSSKQIIDALGKQEVAALRANGATPEAIAAAEERIRRELEGIDAAKESADSVGALQAEQITRQKQNLTLIHESNAAIENAANARAVLASKQGELADVRALLDPSSKAGKELADKQESALANFSRVKNIQDIAPNEAAKAKLQPDVDAAQTRVDEVQAERNRLFQRQSQLESDLHTAEEKKAVAEQESKDAQERSTTNQGRLRQLPGEIEQAGAVQSEKDHARAVIDVLNTHGGKTNQALGAVATAIGISEQQKLNIVEKILNHTLSYQEVWSRIDQRVSNLEAQRQHAP